MKIIFSILILIALDMFGATNASEHQKKNSFSDGIHSYKADYKKNNNRKQKRIKVDRTKIHNDNNELINNKPDSSKEFSEDQEDLNS